MTAKTGGFSLEKALRGALLTCSDHRTSMRLLYFALRRGLPLARLFKPLYGATALIALTYRCQCRCGHCGTGLFKKDEGGELTEREVMKLLRDLRAGGGSGAHFFGGEPLLPPFLLACVREGSRLGLRVTLESNGLLLTPDFAAKLAAAGVQSVRVSLDSHEQEVHDKFRGVPGGWRRSVDALLACKAAGIPTLINHHSGRESLLSGDLDRMIAFSQELGIGLRILPSVRAGNWRGRQDVPPTPEETAQLRSRLSPGKVSFIYEILDRPDTPFRCHSLLRSTFDVSAYGDILACSYIPRSFGNIRREPLAAAVRRMWDADVFSAEASFDGCPLNAPAFQGRYDELLEAGKQQEQ